MSNAKDILYTNAEHDFKLVYDRDGEYYCFGSIDTETCFPSDSSCLDAAEAHRELARQKEIYEAPSLIECNDPAARDRRLGLVQTYRDMIAAIPLSPDEFAAVYAPAL